MVYAAGIGAGGLGFLIVVLLMVAVAIIAVALSKSLRRLRQSVSEGTFGEPEEHAPTSKAAEKPATRPGPGGASV